MESIDLHLKLLSGEEIEAEGFGGVTPLTVRQIIKAGYTTYLRNLNIFTLEIKDLIEEKDLPDVKDLNVLDVLLLFGGDEVNSQLEEACKMFFGSSAKVLKDSHLIMIGDDESGMKFVTRDNYFQVCEVLKWQNGLKKIGKDSFEAEPINERARRIMEKMKKAEEEVNKQKSKEGEDSGDMSLPDIISAVSTKSHSINKLNVFDLTIFQLYDEFKRLDLIDQYDISIKSMLAGASNVKLKHWASPIEA